jgi:predicted phosphodiesterase
MALYGIVSDIHGNLEALCEAVGFLVEERGVDSIVCLGDLVGYNAEPDACVQMVQDLCTDVVVGNHDLIAVGALGYERCADRPAFSLRRTREVLGEKSRLALEALPLRRIIEDEIVLVHGGFRDICQYVTPPARVEENHALMLRAIPRARVCFFGHTHEQKLYEIHKGAARERALGEGVDLSAADRAFFINPGSIDAARKEGQKQAEFAVFDSSRRTVSFHRVPYDHERVEQSAVSHGYRMTPLEERIHRVARVLRRGGGRAITRLRLRLSLLSETGSSL